ncbi:HNH endonuclease [Priestia megaterium]|uniref:HNH endonuclease n=1 Tax=Priestia megaterium TaxID=1404 RepID=UPI002E1AA9E0|nr:HNH endonuclease [Priestia megaterium]
MRFKYEELSSAPLIINSIYEGGRKKNPVADDPLTKLFKVNGFIKSVGNRGGFRKSRKEKNGKVTNKIAYSVIFSSRRVKEWPNKYDESTGLFIYYGDNREPGNNYLSTKQKGNVWLKDIFEKAYGSPKARKTIPPMFVFESTGVGVNVEFLGVAVPGIKGKTMEQALELKTYGESQNQFQNYKAHLTVINIEPEGVNRAWLAQLKDINGDTLKYAPKEWINFVENGPHGVTPINSEHMVTIDNTRSLVLESEKQYLRKVRTTQGKFRECLLKKTPTCKVCGMNIRELLVASHIKPWRDSDDIERVDFFNGLLLCPSHNAAFDAGYISFDNKGNIILSHLLNKENKELLHLDENIKIKLDSRHIYYMDWHLTNVFKK